MFLTMGVSLFTSRVVLDALGINDYGTYNVVGGVVAMFSFFSGSLSAAISRFLTFELGKKNSNQLSIIFSTSVTILLFIAFFLTILVELLGGWFLNCHMNIPLDRVYAANWILQCSIITFAINIISIPYNAAIIAHERMSAFAYISVVEVILKLIVALILYLSPIDKLITYGMLLTIVAAIIRFIYGRYCSIHFAECHFKFNYDKSLLMRMTNFAGWNLLGAGAYLFNTQGVNIATNMYFGVTANAARGVASQVEGIIRQFVTNFTTALNPQITKSYAAGDMQYMYSLVCRGAKFSYFLMFIFAVPFMFETEMIMQLWLKNYPPEAPLFLRLSMVGTLFDILGNSTANATWATGNVRRYYIIVGSVGALVFPLSWLCFAFGMEAYTSYIVFMIIYFILIFVKLYIVKGLINFPVSKYYREVFYSITPVTILSFILPAIPYLYIDNVIIRCLVVCIVSVLSTCLMIYSFGLTKGERIMVNDKTRLIIKKLKH